MKNQVGLGSRIQGRVLPFLNRLDGGFGKNRVSSGYGGVFDGPARRDGCIDAYVPANPNPPQVRRVFRFNPVN